MRSSITLTSPRTPHLFFTEKMPRETLKPGYMYRSGRVGPKRAAARKKRTTIVAAKRGYQQTSGYYGRFAKVTDELKFFDLDIDDAVVATNGTIAQVSCNNIPQGTTESERIGRKCVIKAINWRYEVIMPNAQNMTSVLDTVRVILYLDKQCNGATATVTNILESDDFQSFNNLANKQRFRILMDRTHNLNCTAGAGNGTANDIAGRQESFELFKKCDIPVEFDSTTGAITEIRSNNIGVLLVGKQGFAGFASKMRLRFTG